MSKSADIVTRGMPCHKYILRNITTELEAQSFHKNYVATLVKARVAEDDIMDSLLLLGSQAPNLSYDFTTWENHKEGFGLIDDIRFDNSVATYKKCTQLYKGYDKKCPACCLCPLSNNYCNQNAEIERSIVTFCLAGKENLEKILELGITKAHFRSVCDIFDDFSFVERPVIYPFLSKTFEAISEHGCSFDDLIDFHHKELKKKKFPRKNITNDLLVTICDVLCDQMLGGSVYSYDTVAGYVRELLPPENATFAECLVSAGGLGDVSTVIGERSNLGLKEFDSYYQDIAGIVGVAAEPLEEQPVVSESATPGMDETVLDDDANVVEISLEEMIRRVEAEEFQAEETSENDFSDLDIALEQPFINEPDTEETYIDESTDDGDTCADGGVNTDVDYVSEDEPAEPLTESGPAMEQDKESSDKPTDNPEVSSFEDSSEENPFNHTQEDGLVFREILPIADSELFYHEGDEDDLLGIPVVPLEELQHFCINLDQGVSHLLSIFESHVLKDKRLAVEYIISDNKPYLLMYSPRIHAMFYTTMAPKKVKDILTPLLTKPSIMKVCYYPYALLGVLRKLGIYVKGAYSLFRMSCCLYEGHSMNQRESLESMDCIPAKGGVHLKPDGEITSVPVMYMHNYFSCFYRKKKELVFRALWDRYEEYTLFDSALGHSYYTDLYLKKSGILFKIANASKFIFTDTPGTEKKAEGRILVYRFSHSPAAINLLIMKLLSDLESSGRFRKYLFSVVSMGDSFVAFFIGKKHEQFIMDAIHVALLRYLDDADYRGIEYHIIDPERGEMN